jgi:cytochrome c-type biogenesis protein CcmH/NrfG
MSNKLRHIREIIEKGEIEKSIALLTEYVEENPQDDKAFFLLGNLYRKKEDWRMALNNFRNAIEINPDSPAKEAYKMVIQILDFYNKDMYNH